MFTKSYEVSKLFTKSIVCYTWPIFFFFKLTQTVLHHSWNKCQSVKLYYHVNYKFDIFRVWVQVVLLSET